MQRTISEIDIDAKFESLFHGYTQTAMIKGHRVKLTAICGHDKSTEKFYAESPEGYIRVGLIRVDCGEFERRTMLSPDTKFNMRKLTS